MINYSLLNKKQISDFDDYLDNLTEGEKKDEAMVYMGAFDEDTLIGVAAFLATENPVLMSVCVAEGEEGRGIGSGLVESVCDILKEKGAPSLTAVVDETTNPKENYGKFLFRCGMNSQPMIYNADITLKDALNSKIYNAAIARLRGGKSVVSLKNVPSYLLNSAWEKQSKRRYMPPLSEFAIEKSISVASYINDQLFGWMVYSADKTGITLEHAFVSAKSNNKFLLIHMISASLQLMENKYPLDTVIHMNFQPGVSRQIFSKMFDLDENMVGGQKMYWIDLSRTPQVFDLSLLSESDEEEIFEIENQNKGLGSGSMGSVPVFTQFTNEYLECNGCRYCIYDDVLACHKYDFKPQEVLNGDESCAKFHKD